MSGFDLARVGFDPHCVRRTADDFTHDAAMRPFAVEGTIYRHCDQSFVATHQDPQRSSAFVVVMVAYGPIGLAQSLTPEAAREFADAIKRSADEAEGVVAAQADAAIAKARGQ